MEWVETTGRTIEEAKDAALDQLGVDEAEAEFEIVEEPKAGLFGRVRREARVRARIEPTQPRPKAERRERRRRPTTKKSEGAKTESAASSSADPGTEPEAAAAAGRGGGRKGERSASSNGGGTTRGGRSRQGSSSGVSSSSGSAAKRPAKKASEGASDVTTEIDAAQQGEIVAEFLTGLVGAFDLAGDVAVVEIDEDTVEVQLEGDDLGLLIGPKGQTLASIQDLARTVVQRQADGGSRGRVRVDVSGYRERRRVALERFTRSVAEEVRSSGVQKALEAMGAADRKVVHDTVNEIDGVSTISEGEEPRRRVVLLPDA